jgi:hypothetical protein
VEAKEIVADLQVCEYIALKEAEVIALKLQEKLIGM